MSLPAEDGAQTQGESESIRTWASCQRTTNEASAAFSLLADLLESEPFGSRRLGLGRCSWSFAVTPTRLFCCRSPARAEKKGDKKGVVPHEPAQGKFAILELRVQTQISDGLAEPAASQRASGSAATHVPAS